MFQIGMVCMASPMSNLIDKPSEKCAFLKNVSYWQCANLVISKPRVKYKVLKHKKLRKGTETKADLHLLALFGF